MRIQFLPTASVAALLAIALSPLPANAETVAPLSARTALGLTIYNNNLALVRDTRQVALPSGSLTLRFPGVTEAINPSSLFIEQTPRQALAIREVNFDAQTLTWDALLRKSIGQRIRFKSAGRAKGAEHLTDGILLDVSGGHALVETGGQARNIPKNRITLPLPTGPRRLKPSLSIAGVAASAKPVTFALTYMTGGLSWRSDYVGRLNADETMLSLNSYVTLSNTTSAVFENARVRVVAGSTNRTRQRQPRLARAESLSMKSFAHADVVETPVSDLHVISIGENLTLGPRQSKQIALFQIENIPVIKEYRLENHSASYNRAYPAKLQDHPTIRYVFKNDAISNLNRILPSGVVRLYANADGSPLFLGETVIQHTARGETVRLTTGRAFEIKAERRQTHYRRSGLPKGVFESGHEVKIRNGKSKAVIVLLRERIPGEWRILSESQPHEAPQSNIAVWRVDVPAHGETTIRYSVRVQF